MRQVMLGAVLVLWPLAAMAQGAGNLPPGFYPQPKCEKPLSPGKPPESPNQPAMQAYNAKVKVFNKQAESFNACMKDYSERAQTDINLILATVHAAVLAANAH
jgi:hypothetical protein